MNLKSRIDIDEVILNIDRIHVEYGEGKLAKTALEDVSFVVKKGEFVCIVGPSGCGKTTLLRCVTGLQTPTSGAVHLKEESISRPVSEMALVFQDYSRSLLPWMSIRQNVELPLRNQAIGQSERAERVRSAVAAVGLADFIDYYPWQLSGGMQQRAAIARAIAFESEVLVMDEPFASVDAQTRAELEDLLLELSRARNLTVLFVTHDIDESVYLGDRVVVLSQRPTTVLSEHIIDLPRDRDQLITKSDPRFVDLRADVMRDIRRI